MFKARINTPCGVSILVALVSSFPALAQVSLPTDETLVEAELPTMVAIEDRLNAAKLCTPLQFDLRTISGLLGLPIPAFIPIDTNLRWDQSRHRVTRFASSPTKVELDFKLGCQPSTNGVALDFFGLSPDKVRLDDDVKCVGSRTPDGELGTLVCHVDGKIGRFLSKNIIGLSAKVAKLLPMNLAVPVTAPTSLAPGAEAAAPAGEEAERASAASGALPEPSAGMQTPAGQNVPAAFGTPPQRPSTLAASPPGGTANDKSSAPMPDASVTAPAAASAAN